MDMRCRRRLILWVGLTAGVLMPGTLPAAIVNEIEVNGQAVNNTLATAQVLDPSSFTLPVPPTVFDSPGPLPFPTVTIRGWSEQEDVDFYRFEAQAGQLLVDIDNDEYDIPRLDSIVALYDGSGTLIGYSGDDAGDPGSAEAFLDSFLGTYTLTTAGTYYLAVSTVGNEPLGYLANGTQLHFLNRPDGGSGGYLVTEAPVGNWQFQASGIQPDDARAYTLHLSVQNPQVIPEPSSLALMGLGLGALGLYARRRTSRPRA